MTESSDAGWDLAEEIQTRGNSAYTVARAFPRRGSRGRAPLGIAGFLGIPLFFCSLMASTLAQEKAHKIQWQGCKHICTILQEPTAGNVARIWLWALVPSLVLVVIGFVACRIPLGFYVSCVAGIVIAMGVVHKTATWERHHVARFPLGEDLIPSSNTFSNLFDPGEWERDARNTAVSLQHWTIGIALAAMLVMALLWVRARYFSRRPAVAGVFPPAVITGEPEASPVIELEVADSDLGRGGRAGRWRS
ncbi:MAG TPA: hypothetical protein VJ838_02620 [Gaiellaceae bacterium]|nr:hypothetical protein [Gaiellaceae bacterium]